MFIKISLFISIYLEYIKYIIMKIIIKRFGDEVLFNSNINLFNINLLFIIIKTK